MRSDARVALELNEYENGELDPQRFSHSEHVRLAFEMLAAFSFSEALIRFSRGLKLLAAKAGRPEVYNETITVAFLALIGERRLRGQFVGWQDFIRANPDLLEKRVLESWYEPAQLKDEVARQTFCLPPAPFKDFPKPRAEVV